ncbi:MAG: hypothetical protein O6848_05545, partial [Bacteroidetes bacterium]|nr:hypothetical protein [Bacteroidota bacterium]
ERSILCKNASFISIYTGITILHESSLNMSESLWDFFRYSNKEVSKLLEMTSTLLMDILDLEEVSAWSKISDKYI